MYQDWMNVALAQGFEELHAKVDVKTGLQALVAIHDTTAGPSLGGCRIRQYDDTALAMEDVMRLARGMTLKSVLADLPLGGGKAVIMMPASANWNRKALFESFGAFLDTLQGRYITAMDMGTSVADMDVIASKTRYVTCTSGCEVGPSDPSSVTALGVFYGICASVKEHFKTADLSGIRVAIQGVGHVGMTLAKLLHDAGAELIVCDADSKATEYCQKTFGAQVVELDAIYDAECDIFSPCAIGGILTDSVIARLKATVVAGAANNQLISADQGQHLYDRGILYAPDYVINAGGIIHVAAQYTQASESEIIDKVKRIESTCSEIFHRAKSENQPTSIVAEEIALEKLAQLKTKK